MEKTRFALLTSETWKGETEGNAALHSPAIFKALLRHERSRSDRDGSEFSLVIFDVSAMNSNSRGIKQAVCGIREKMRSIDEIGWLDARNIGVLLPVTNLQGGRRFANRASDSASSAQRIPWTAYTYPAHWLPGGNGGSGGDSLPTAWPEGNGGTDPRPRAKENRFSDLRAALCLRTPAWKRGMDIVGSLVLIGILSPLFLLVAVYIKTVSRGKVFFRQKRVGYQGKLFTFLKFRTMQENNDPRAHRDYLKELIRGGKPMEKLDIGVDPRIIPGGKIIRKTCLDELPQLFNVLRGEMSLVGPRPCIPYEAEEYQRWHTHRFDILPGMTGLWQVSGKNKLSFLQMIRLDIAYTNKMSPLLDLKILLLTLPTIIVLVFDAGLKRLRSKGLEPAKKHVYESDEKKNLGNA
jgi:lipopolysaccharide/colanic/teichoic acid biosynthesis glycosyltransferase